MNRFKSVSESLEAYGGWAWDVCGIDGCSSVLCRNRRTLQYLSHFVIKRLSHFIIIKAVALCNNTCRTL